MENVTSTEEMIERIAHQACTSSASASSKTEYIFVCPNDNCKGFINKDYYCDICKTQFCSRCFGAMRKDQEHVCSPDDIKTMNDILSNTKSCPTCKARIYRTSGCPCMFCTHCHTGFNWESGEVLFTGGNPFRTWWDKVKEKGTTKFPRVLSSNIAFYNKYIKQIDEYKDIILKLNQSMMSSQKYSKEEITRELIKYMLRWDNTFEEMITDEIITINKKSYLIEILDNYVTEMQATLERIGYLYLNMFKVYGASNMKNAISQVYGEITGKYSNKKSTCVDECRPIFQEYIHQTHDITERMNVELEHYSEAFLCERVAIFDDTFQE